MKIVIISNYNNELINDRLFCENISYEIAKKIANIMNESIPDDHPDFYEVVDDDYKLYKWQP